MKASKIFALDIGTRKVMGIVARVHGNEIQVIDSEVVEHPTRAMSAGQIQDIGKVAQVVRQVTASLSDRTGEPLTKAAVAVAGRNLKTLMGKASLYCPKDRVLEARDIEKLTCDALEDALRRLSLESIENPKNAQYYCVGYVISRFTLDGEHLTQPVGHRGEKLEAEVLATFLPRQVLETQIVVLEAAGLEATSVTLEPIAALQAVVNQDLRQFNLAMVDVGAGTSDIALVSDGVIRSFGMVPCAGDFVTEKICSEFLLEFNTAERIKRAAAGAMLAARPDNPAAGATILEAVNIFHQPVRMTAQEVMAAIQPAVTELAYRIAKCILELGSGHSPQTVLCVGGGALTPGLLSEIAHAMRMNVSRVGTRSPGGVQGLTDSRGRLMGPETATPLGIACVASVEGGVRFRRILFNGRRLFMLEFGRPLTVLSVLTTAGIAAKEIFGWPGRSKTFTVNGEFRIFNAKPAAPARVVLNGVPVDLSHPIMEGDRIEFTQAECREDSSGTIGEALGLERQHVSINGAQREIHARVFMNNRLIETTRQLEDRMNLIVEPVRMRDILGPEEMRSSRVLLNGLAASLDDIVRDGDAIETMAGTVTQPPQEAPARPSWAQEEPQPTAAQRAEPPAEHMREADAQAVRVKINGRWEVLRDQKGAPLLPGRDAPPLLVDALRHIAIGPGVVGKRLKLMLNGREAHFTSILHDGADIQVYFE